MEMETKRLNPLSSRDWQYCSDSVPNTLVWKVAIVVLSLPMTILILAAFSGILDAIPEGAGKDWAAPLFGASLIVGTFTVSFLITNLYMVITAAVFFMVRGRRQADGDVAFEQSHVEYPGQPVTAALGEALRPQEASSAYEVDCSITLLCHGCGKELCPGCGSDCMVSFFLRKAYVWCKECMGGDSQREVKEFLRNYYGTAQGETV